MINTKKLVFDDDCKSTHLKHNKKSSFFTCTTPEKVVNWFYTIKKQKTKNKQTNKNSLECCEDDLHMIIPYSKWTLLNLVLEKLTTLP